MTRDRAREGVVGSDGEPARDGLHARFLARFDRWGHVLALVGVVTLIRLAWTLWLSPYALSEDEAHYWEWSRRLDLSYYSKGPGIAWTIALSTWMLGDTVAGVRALAPILGGACALAVGALARRVIDDPRVGLVAAGLTLLIPAYQITALLMTIDVAYLACWAIAAMLAQRAIIGGQRAAWAGVGLALGVGFLYKYTILLLALGVVSFLIVRRRTHRGRGDGAEGKGSSGWFGPLAGLGLFALCALPVVIWNARQGFPTVRHLLGHLGLAAGDIPRPAGCGGSDGFFPLWTLEFLGVQALIVGPTLGLMAMGVARVLGGARRSRAGGEPARRGGEGYGEVLCVCMGSVVLAFYFLVSLFSEGEANWPIAGYLTLLPIAAREGLSGMDRLLSERARWREEKRKGREPANVRHLLLSGAIVYGVFAGTGVLMLDPISRLPMVRGSAIEEAARLERLRRGPVLADRVLGEIENLRAQTGLEPFVIGSHYGRVSLLAFEFARRGVGIEVFCASAVLPAFPEEGICPGRRTQYDLWMETSLRENAVVDRLRGRPAVLLGGRRVQWQEGFESVSELFEDGWDQDRVSFIAHGFKGWE